MLSLNRQRLTRCITLALAAILLAAVDCASAAERPAPGDVVPCQTVVSNFLTRAPVIRRSNERIARLLNGRQYRRAAAALRSATRGYPDAWAGYALGSLYAAGLGVPRRADDAFRWYLWSAKRGDRFAQQRVANAYLNGDGTQRNATEAAYWFRIGIAPFQLARMYYSLSQTYAGARLAPVNRSKAGYYLDKSLADLRELAKEPNGEAAYYLGLAYEYGDGVPPDRAKAVGYLCRAASLQYDSAFTAIRRLQGQSQ